MEPVIISAHISSGDVKEMASAGHGDMVKGVADVGKRIIALGGELHADAEALLLEHGSAQSDLWGFNIYPDKPGSERLEYTSFINIRPGQGNRSMEITSETIRAEVRRVVDSLIGGAGA